MKKTPLAMLLLAFTVLLAVATRAAEAAQKNTFVIVHGATAGGWEWKKVGEFLTADGQTVYRPTLTGLGEREHLNSPDIDLNTHITDVVNTILWEDLHDIVLVGHSYGGMVITGVMNRVPDRIRHVIFLDAAVPDNGMSLYDLFGSDRRPPGPAVADGFMQVPWVKPGTPPPHNVKQSIKCFNTPVAYDNPAALTLPVTYVAFVPADQNADERAAKDKSWQHAKARGWTIRTFPGHHVAHVENPRGVATLIEESANDQNAPAAAAPTPAAK
ncbi:MAG TPA: alpha/beta hydrolase [Opitutus sp.]|nr:alpha/beta hydrolase [Opitutus sp.]